MRDASRDARDVETRSADAASPPFSNTRKTAASTIVPALCARPRRAASAGVAATMSSRSSLGRSFAKSWLERARATSVELAAAGPTLWAAVGAARAAAAKLLGDVITDDPAELRALAERREAFFMDLTGADLASEAARAAHLAEKLAQQDEGAARGDAGALSVEEEEELVGLLKKNKRWLSGKDSDDEDSDSDGEGILANLAAEDEELPEEMRKEAVDKLEAELREMEAKAKK